MCHGVPTHFSWTLHSTTWRPTPALRVGPITEESEWLPSVHIVWLSLHQLYRLRQCGCHCLPYAYCDRNKEKSLKTPSPCWTMEVPRLCLRTWILKHSGLWRWMNGFRRFGGSRFLVEKPTGSQVFKKFPTFYGIRRFIATFTSAHHLFLSWARSVFQYAINLSVSLPMRRGHVVLPVFQCGNIVIFWCGKAYDSNAIIITILM